MRDTELCKCPCGASSWVRVFSAVANVSVDRYFCLICGRNAFYFLRNECNDSYNVISDDNPVKEVKELLLISTEKSFHRKDIRFANNVAIPWMYESHNLNGIPGLPSGLIAYKRSSEFLQKKGSWTSSNTVPLSLRHRVGLWIRRKKLKARIWYKIPTRLKISW